MSPFYPCSSGLAPSASINRLVTAAAPRAVACDTRLVGSTLLYSALGPHLKCPECLLDGNLWRAGEWRDEWAGWQVDWQATRARGSCGPCRPRVGRVGQGGPAVERAGGCAPAPAGGW